MCGDAEAAYRVLLRRGDGGRGGHGDALSMHMDIL
jgi:hypothetical protein